MKIITRCVMDMTSGKVLEEESFEYHGPVAECKGGGDVEGAPDSYYESMAQIAEEQQGMAREMYNLYRHGQETDPSAKEYKVDGKWMNESEARRSLAEERTKTVERGGGPYGMPITKEVGPDPGEVDLSTVESRTTMAGDEGNLSQFDLEQMKLEASRNLLPQTTELKEAQLGLATEKAQANREVLPKATGLRESRIEAQQQLLPQKTGLEEQQIGLKSDVTEARRELLPQKQEAQEAYFNEAMSGVDVENWADRAGAEAQRNVGNAIGQMERKAQRLGLDPSDQNFQESLQQGGLDLARAKTGARQKARQAAKKENFRRLGQAASSGL